MRVEIIQDGRVLRSTTHNGQTYVEAPPSGPYQIRLTNDSPHRRMGVVTVDGVNVIDGKDGTHKGPGYVLGPWQSFTLKGWMRSNSEVAAFEFKPNEVSYANQTGRGKKNTGVIGVAVFDEKPKPPVFPLTKIVEHHHHHHDHWPWPPIYPRITFTTTTTSGIRGPELISETFSASTADSADSQFTMCSVGPPQAAPAASAIETEVVTDLGAREAEPTKEASRSRSSKKAGGVLRSAEPSPVKAEVTDLGTGYGQRMAQYVDETVFDRATKTPVMTVVLRYAMREKLIEWGVPVENLQVGGALAPDPFPASPGHVPPPPGWNG